MKAAVNQERQARSAVLGRRAAEGRPLIVRADGVHLYDEQGKSYLDAVGGAGVAILDHADPRVLERLAQQRHGLGFTYGAFFDNPWQQKLARRLVELTGLAGGAAVLASGGTEANEVALKLARYAALASDETERAVVVTRDRSYHGNTMAALRISGRPSWREPLAAMADVRRVEISLPYCYRCPGDDPDCDLGHADELRDVIERIGPRRVLGFMIEPIVGTSATAVRPSVRYMKRVRDICDDYGVLLIADEVMCGHWRTGRGLAMHHFGVQPDIVTLGKSLASGFAPLAACVTSQAVRDAVVGYTGAPLTHGFTFSGNPVSSALGVIVGELCDEIGLYERPASVGAALLDRLTAWAQGEEAVGDVRGSGLLLGVEFVADRTSRTPFPAEARFAHRVTEEALDLGVVIVPGIREGTRVTAADHIQLTPPFVLTESHADQIVDVLARATRTAKDSLAREKPAT